VQQFHAALDRGACGVEDGREPAGGVGEDGGGAACFGSCSVEVPRPRLTTTAMSGTPPMGTKPSAPTSGTSRNVSAITATAATSQVARKTSGKTMGVRQPKCAADRRAAACVTTPAIVSVTIAAAMTGTMAPGLPWATPKGSEVAS